MKTNIQYKYENTVRITSDISIAAGIKTSLPSSFFFLNTLQHNIYDSNLNLFIGVGI
jgi:hypothetical protein